MFSTLVDELHHWKKPAHALIVVWSSGEVTLPGHAFPVLAFGGGRGLHESGAFAALRGKYRRSVNVSVM